MQTYDLMRGAVIAGMDISVAGPDGPDYGVPDSILKECEELKRAHRSPSNVVVTTDPAKAVADADVV